MEASIMTSLGPCRFVIPLLDFTMPSSGPRPYSPSTSLPIPAPHLARTNGDAALQHGRFSIGPGQFDLQLPVFPDRLGTFVRAKVAGDHVRNMSFRIA